MFHDIVRAKRQFVAMRERRIPSFKIVPQKRRREVYYLAPHWDGPSGGIRVIYRHVDVLNELGIPAYVMHSRRGFACSWFEHETPIVTGRDAALSPDDVLVVPEWYGPGLSRMRRDGPRLVVFNQRAYDTYDFVEFDGSNPEAPYANLPQLAAVLTVSQDNADFLSYAFPSLRVATARNVVDSDVFHPRGSPSSRRRQIAVVPTRRANELHELQHILRARGILDEWTLLRITGQTERRTAQLMRESPIFLSLSEREGFGMPPAEAMASGCYVVGYTGLAGREYLPPRTLLRRARWRRHRACSRGRECLRHL